MGNLRTIEDGVNHHLVGRNRSVQHVFELHLDVLVVNCTACHRIEQFLGLHIIIRDVGNMDMDGHLLATTIQIDHREAGVQALRHVGPCATQLVNAVGGLLLTQGGRSGVRHEELREAVRTGNVLTAVVALVAGSRTVVGAVGLHENLQVAAIEVERSKQIEVEPTGVIEEDTVIQHEGSAENLIIPVHRCGIIDVFVGTLHVNLHRNTCTGGGGGGGFHTQRERADGAVTDFLLQIEDAAAGIAVAEGERIGAVAGTRTYDDLIHRAGVGGHIVGGIEVDQRGGIGVAIAQQIP